MVLNNANALQPRLEELRLTIIIIIIYMWALL